MTISRIYIPADVPPSMHTLFSENMHALTKGTKNIFVFSCDQKIEHLNDDFYGPTISSDALYPEHLFTIASQGAIGAMALPLGLLTRYGTLYPHINYIAKLSGTTNAIAADDKESMSALLWSVEEVIACKQASDIAIRGVGITVYVGSQFENAMLAHAAQIISKAHQHGLVAMLWMYARGKALLDSISPELMAGMTGLAHALGADIVKIKPPHKHNHIPETQQLRIATVAAGNTAVVCAGGALQEVQPFLQNLSLQIQEGKTNGSAIGRTIFQRPLPEALAITHAINSIVYTNESADNAYTLYEQKLAEYLLQMHS